MKGLALFLLASGVLALSIGARLLIGSPTLDTVRLGVTVFAGLGLVLIGLGIALAWWGWNPP